MKVWKTLAAVFLTGVILATLFGCSSDKDIATNSTQEYTVKKGDISLTITAAGNLDLSRTEDLVVDLFYTSGTKATIGSVLVEEGDSVTEGQVLVTLDKDEWDEQMSTLQKSLSTAERNVGTKSIAVTDAERSLASLQRAVTTAENNVAKAERDVTAAQLNVIQKQLAVTSANISLHDIDDVQDLQEKIDNAQFAINMAIKVLGGELGGGLSGDFTYWEQMKNDAQSALTSFQADMRELLGGTSTTTTEEVALQVGQKQVAYQSAVLALQEAEIAVDEALRDVTAAQIAVEDAKYAITKQERTLANAKLDLEDAELTFDDTQKKLTDAEGKSPEIKATFNGFVTDINVNGGDEVANGTVAVTIADPDRFEADILVSEMDIMKIALGGEATISLNALTGVKLPASITHIAPTATISSGVVNYAVKVELDAQAATRLQQGGSPGPVSNNNTVASGDTAGQLSTVLQRMVDSGRITREQAEQYQAQGTVPEGFSPRSGISLPEGFTGMSGGSSQSQLPSTAAQAFELKQGLTGTVELVVSQSTNVVVVPNSALTTSGGKKTVQLVKEDGTTETRTVEVGLSDWQNTEITSGLSEGDIILINKIVSISSSSSSSSQRIPSSGGIFIGR